MAYARITGYMNLLMYSASELKTSYLVAAGFKGHAGYAPGCVIIITNENE